MKLSPPLPLLFRYSHGFVALENGERQGYLLLPDSILHPRFL